MSRQKYQKNMENSLKSGKKERMLNEVKTVTSGASLYIQR